MKNKAPILKILVKASSYQSVNYSKIPYFAVPDSAILKVDVFDSEGRKLYIDPESTSIIILGAHYEIADITLSVCSGCEFQRQGQGCPVVGPEHDHCILHHRKIYSQIITDLYNGANEGRNNE